jgi:hypothetical protein
MAMLHQLGSFKNKKLLLKPTSGEVNVLHLCSILPSLLPPSEETVFSPKGNIPNDLQQDELVSQHPQIFVLEPHGFSFPNFRQPFAFIFEIHEGRRSAHTPYFLTERISM